jgi:hypothetical protein
MWSSAKLCATLLFLLTLHLLSRDSSLAENITVIATCNNTDKSLSGNSNFYLQADQVSLSMSSFDKKDPEVVIHSLVVPPYSPICFQSSSARGNGTRLIVYIPLLLSPWKAPWAEMTFLTNATDVQSMNGDGSWRLVDLWIYLSNVTTGLGNAYGLNASAEEIGSLGWEGSSLGQGYKCPKTHIRLGKNKELDIKNVRLFPFASLRQRPTDNGENFWANYA